MEKNISKRVVAGTLALLTVFGSAPATLQGVFAPTALVADAATAGHKLNLVNIADYVESLKIGTDTYDAATLKRFGTYVTIDKNTAVELTTTVKLVIDVNDVKDMAVTETVTDGKYKYAFTTKDTDGGDIDFTVKTANYGFDNNRSSTKAEVIISGKTCNGNTFADLNNIGINYAEGQVVDYNGAFAIGDKVKLTSAKPIAVKINDNNQSAQYVKPVTQYDAENKVFFVEFTVIPSTTDAPVTVTIEDATEDFTYTAAGRELKASTASKSFDNTVVGAIAVTRAKTAADGEVEGDTVTVADGTKLAYNTDTTVKLSNAAEVATIKSVEIKKDGTALAYDKNTTAIGAAAEGQYVFNASGVYTVTYVLTGKNGTDYTLTATFEIKTVDPLTADNFDYALYLTTDTTNGKPNGVVTDGTPIAGAFADGKVTFTIPKGKKAIYNDKQFTIVAKQKATGPDHQNAGGVEALGADALTYSGTQSGTTKDNEYTVKLEIDDTKYGKQTLPVKWEVKDQPEEVVIKWAENDLVNDNDVPAVQKQNLKKTVLENALNTYATQFEKLDADKLSFEYTDGEKGLGSDIENLDGRKENLPTETNKKYTVYVVYDGETKFAMDLELKENENAPAVKTVFDDQELVFTEALDLEDFKAFYVESGAEVLAPEEGIEATVAKIEMLTEDENGAVVVGDKKYTATTVYAPPAGQEVEIKNEAYCKNDLGGKFYLMPGLYKVTYGTVIKGGSDAEKFYKANADADKCDTSIITVAKKELTSDMLSIKTKDYNAGTKYDIVKTGELTVTDADNVFGVVQGDFKITEGTSESAIGTYEAKVSVVNANSPYVGKNVVGNWKIANPTNKANASENIWWTEGSASIKSNGALNFNVTRAINEKNTSIGDNKTIVRFGVLLDKAGVIDTAGATKAYKADAPQTFENWLGYSTFAEPGVVANQLVLGAGFTESKKVNPTDTNYEFNVSVTDVKQKVVARPYILYSDDTVDYGEIRVFTLEEQAQKLINLRVSNVGENGKAYSTDDVVAYNKKVDAGEEVQTAKKTAEDIRSGYIPTANKYFTYCQINQLEKKNDLTLQVEKFGVIVDKKGVFGAIDEFADNVAKATELKKVSDGLVKGKGFIEGNYDPDSAVLKNTEYSAKIKPVDSVTGVWVRGYVDLGNNLIVYTEPFYMESASEYYGYGAKTANVVNDVVTVDGANMITTETIAAKAGVDASKVTVTRVGAVMDPENTSKDIAKNAEGTKNLVLGNGFKEGFKTVSALATYSSYAKHADGKAGTLARGFVEYSIDGLKIVLYTATNDHFEQVQGNDPHLIGNLGG